MIPYVALPLCASKLAITVASTCAADCGIQQLIHPSRPPKPEEWMMRVGPSRRCCDYRAPDYIGALCCVLPSEMHRAQSAHRMHQACSCSFDQVQGTYMCTNMQWLHLHHYLGSSVSLGQDYSLIMACSAVRPIPSLILDHSVLMCSKSGRPSHLTFDNSANCDESLRARLVVSNDRVVIRRWCQSQLVAPGAGVSCAHCSSSDRQLVSNSLLTNHESLQSNDSSLARTSERTQASSWHQRLTTTTDYDWAAQTRCGTLDYNVPWTAPRRMP